MVSSFESMYFTVQTDAQYAESLSLESCFHISLLYCEFETCTYEQFFVVSQPVWKPAILAHISN